MFALTFLVMWENSLIRRLMLISKFMALQTRKQMIVKAVAQRCSVKKVFLEISQNSQENTCARVSFLLKFQD